MRSVARSCLMLVSESQQHSVRTSDTKGASPAKESLRTGVPVKKLVLKHGLMKEKQLDEVLDPYAMTEAATKKSKAKVG